ncbi:MAG: ribonuclease P protein component [Clostridia bacterium]|nr:ribonuclease P protein component [Clostridia bacterium]
MLHGKPCLPCVFLYQNKRRSVLLKRCFSLKRNKQFRQVYRKGKSLASRSMVIIYARSKSDMVHVGFSVSKKLGNSVTRNRIKRRLREAFRPMVSEALPGYDLIFIAREAVKEAEFSAIENAMRYLMRKAGLLQKAQRP